MEVLDTYRPGLRAKTWGDELVTGGAYSDRRWQQESSKR